MSYYNKDLKYKSLEDLIKAYKTGELKDALTIDNDNLSVWTEKPGEPDKYVKVFHYKASAEAGLLEDALQLLGIPSEWC